MKNRIAIKVNNNVLYDNFNYCEKEFNVELYYLEMEKGISKKKGVIYDLSEEDIYNIKSMIEKKYELDVEIMWNSFYSEM